MTGREFDAIRKRHNLSVVQFGLLLGYQGNTNTISRTVRGYQDRGDDDVPEHIGRLVWLLDTNFDGLPGLWLHEAGIGL